MVNLIDVTSLSIGRLTIVCHANVILNVNPDFKLLSIPSWNKALLREQVVRKQQNIFKDGKQQY
jgi:hypothetical protein